MASAPGRPPTAADGTSLSNVLRRRNRSTEGQASTSNNGSEHSAAEQEQQIIAALADFRDTTVREVMTPRVDVIGLPIPVHASDVAKAVRETGHSSFPVYDDDLDRLIGVLFVNDLFRAGWEIDGPDAAQAVPGNPTPMDISRRLRQPLLVPESRLVLDVLADMREKRRGFAVVVDEYGGVAGVVTVKNLLEALVGDLRDEHDPAGEPDIIRVDRTRWLVDGSASIDDVTEQLGVDIPEGEYVTLGGFLFDAFGHIPEEGEKVRQGNWELRVAEMDRRRVAKVVIQELAPEVPETGVDH